MKKKIVIAGGGFGGVYTALYLEKLFKKSEDWEIVLINRENYFVYQPMLAEVVGGSVGILDTVSALRRLIPKATLYIREIDSIDIQGKTITLAPQFTHKPTVVHFDHLIIALGNVTDFREATGLYEHALPFKNLSDALRIRNHVIDTIEAAAIEENPVLRKMLLTYVVGGGGFSGTEIVAEINDFVHKIAKRYPHLNREEIKVVLLHGKERLMERELSENLSRYAEKILKKRGVEIRFGIKLVTATPEGGIVDTGERIASKTIISTVPATPNPLIETLGLPLEKGRIKTDATLKVLGENSIWAIGDCAYIPDLNKEGTPCPPTAQFAIREAKILAGNIYAVTNGKRLKSFRFKSLGMLGALGHRNAVAELFGKIKISGFPAWVLWRAIYWTKLPGFDRKLKVAFSWMLDMIIPIESVQLKLASSQGIIPLHFETGEYIFHEGDTGDYLYIIVKGTVEILKEKEGKDVPIATLRQGEYFGEMSLLNQKTRSASVRCLEPVNVLAIRKSDFGVLIANFAQLREEIKQTEEQRRKKQVS